LIIPIVEHIKSSKEHKRIDNNSANNECVEKSKKEELWREFVNDCTQYELSDKSDDSDNDIDENYDSIYFGETEIVPIKHGQPSKRLATCKGKMIAKWAENKERVNELMSYQERVLDSNKIFGRLTIDTIELHDVFGIGCSRIDIRGSSANWKNEYWTPFSPFSPSQTRGITRDDKDPVENLDGKFKLSQTCESPEFGKQADTVIENESSYDILEL